MKRKQTRHVCFHRFTLLHCSMFSSVSRTGCFEQGVHKLDPLVNSEHWQDLAYFPCVWICVFCTWSTNSICAFVFLPWSTIGIVYLYFAPGQQSVFVYIYFDRRNPPSVDFPFPPAFVLNLTTADQDCENISHLVKQYFSFCQTIFLILSNNISHFVITNKQTALEKVRCARTRKILWLVPDDEDGLPLLQGELVFILSGVREQHQALLFDCKRCHQFIAWQSSKPQKQAPKRNHNLSFHSWDLDKGSSFVFFTSLSYSISNFVLLAKYPTIFRGLWTQELNGCLCSNHFTWHVPCVQEEE